MLGCPIRKSSDITLVCSSPKLIAAYHVLHRLSDPRHSPCALNCFKKFKFVLIFLSSRSYSLYESLSQYVKELYQCADMLISKCSNDLADDKILNLYAWCVIFLFTRLLSICLAFVASHSCAFCSVLIWTYKWVTQQAISNITTARTKILIKEL